MNVKYLTGPISLDYYINSTTGDQIYIFGDHHIIKPQCPCDGGSVGKIDIASFIVDLALSREIDLFIEEPINAAGSLLTKLHGESYIDVILKRVETTPNLNLNLYKIDWRQSTSIEAPYNYYLCLTIYHTLDLIFSQKQPEFHPAFTDKYYTFLSILKNTQVDEWLARISSARVRNYFIKQYFSRFIPPSEFKRMVGRLRNLYLAHHQNKITFTYKDGRIEGFQTVGTRACLFLKKIEKFCKRVLDGMMLIQDFYGVARILGSSSPRNVTTPRNVVVYVGHNHLKFYKGALRLVGFERKHRVRDKKSFQCLDISGIQQPFFTLNHK